ncbi:MAG: hypothetical protein H8D23_10815 [Candidatus Brocadiales bacterium]|nr:hypothetical protein [Candidatus Brocadiales bacterium]
MYYKQCHLKKGTVEQVAWIPERYAQKNKVLRIQEEEGWVVTFVGASKDESFLNEFKDLHRTHRKVTDI